MAPIVQISNGTVLTELCSLSLLCFIYLQGWPRNERKLSSEQQQSAFCALDFLRCTEEERDTNEEGNLEYKAQIKGDTFKGKQANEVVVRVVTSLKVDGKEK